MILHSKCSGYIKLLCALRADRAPYKVKNPADCRVYILFSYHIIYVYATVYVFFIPYYYDVLLVHIVTLLSYKKNIYILRKVYYEFIKIIILL